MYILVFEDGKVKKAKEISREDLISVDVGILTIIRVSDLKQYYDNDWHDMEEA